MATSSSKLSIVMFFLLFSILFLSSSASSGVTTKYPSASSHRSLLAFQRNKKNQIPNCSEMASRSQCLQDPKCRWCRSEVLDDMCFSKGESWRLPEQKEARYFGQVKLLDLKLPSQENLIADKFYG